MEIHVCASLEECLRRDPKGLYVRALAGEIPNFTGISSPYEEPESPEIVVDTGRNTPEESTAAVVRRLEELGVL